MKTNRTKKIFAIFFVMVLFVGLFSDIPESLMNMFSYSTEAETETENLTVIIRADYSSTDEIVLTAVFKNEKGETVSEEDVGSDVSYTWYKSTSSYASASDVPTDRNEIEYEAVTASASSSDNDSETASTSDNDADETETEEETEAQAEASNKSAYSLLGLLGALEAEAADENSNSITVEKGYVYYVSVTVGGASVTPLKAEPKYVSIDIAGVKIQNDIYRDSVLTALLVNSEGDTLYFSDGGDMTTYNGDATYTWYRYSTAASTYVYTDQPTTEIMNAGITQAEESTDKNTLTPTMGATSYYYYVTVTVSEEEYTSETRIADVYDGITVEIEQVKADDSKDITLYMVVYDDNGDVMYDNGEYYYNSNYTTTWYKSKEYFASIGNGTTADDDSKVETDATIPLGYAPQDYYNNSNYMRVTNAVYNASTNTVGYTNTLTVSDEVGRYYYVDINKNKANGSAEAGADPVFVRNCVSTVVVEDHIAEDGTFKAVVYDADGKQVTDTDSYTYTWYKTVSGTTSYVNDKDDVKTSNPGTFVSTYSSNNTTSYTTSAYYSDSGKFMRNNKYNDKTSEYGGTLPDTNTYGLVRGNFSEELQTVSDVFANANYDFNANTNSTEKFEITDGSSTLNDGSSCNVAMDEGQLRYYYVVVEYGGTEYTSFVKYVKYSNQIENGGFQDYANQTESASTLEASIMPYWETTNKGYTESYKKESSTNEQYYRMHPVLEIGNYLSGNSNGTYGNYYSYPGLTYDKDDPEKIQKSKLDAYYEMGYDDDATTDYVNSANQFCEINSTDCNTLYQTVMTIPGMPLYWSLTHHARTSSSTTTITDVVIYKDESGNNVTAASLGATSATVCVAIDVMYVVIMNETDAERLLSNGADQAAQQEIIDAMVLYITANNDAQVIQTSEDGSSYLARYDGSYTYGETTYDNISVWRVQTGSTRVILTFGTDETAQKNAEAAASNKELLAYYAEKYGTVKSGSYSSKSTSNGTTTYTYYAGFYTESETYSATYDIPDGQYVSRYFFVAGSSSNSVGANGTSSAYSAGGLTFGTYMDDEGIEQTISDYNGLTKATNGTSSGNFIDNVRFMQQLEVEVNYWLYDANEGKYVLQKADTEESNTFQDRTVTADADTVEKYYSKYKFVGSYVSADGGDEDTPNEEKLGSVTSFKADTDSALVLDLYYTPYDLEFEKEITGLPMTMHYDDFKNALTITIYKLTYDEITETYTKGDEAIIDTYLEYDDTDDSLTLSTDYIFEKGYYLITETTDILITDEFDGWFSVDMSVEIGGLEYNEDLGGFILHVDEDENGIDLDSYADSDGKMKIYVVNVYKPVAVECTKSVVFGSTDLDAINTALTGTADYDTITSLNYASLTEYDEENEVDDTKITSDSERRAVLSGDTLTYRMELTSTKNATGISVTDTVPDGCTLVEGSIKILYQKRDDKAGSHYGIVSSKLLTGDASVTTAKSGDTTTWTVYDAADPPNKLYEITYDSGKGEITWWISEIGFYEQYYVEYEVKVDQIKASAEKDILENTAEYEYLSEYVSSDSLTSVKAGMTTSEYNGTVTYTVTFEDLSDYAVSWLKNTLPEGFTLDTTAIKINDTEVSTTYTIKYYDSNGNELTGTYAASASYFIIEPDMTNTTAISTDGGKITLTFSGTYDSSVLSFRNATGIKFSDIGSKEYCAVVSYGEGVTNQVETDVTHLYFEIEKVIYEDDPAQTFLFEVAYTPEGGTAADTQYSYVTINCTNEVTEGDVTYYTGSTIVQSDERGTYTITEVTDWSNTDYKKDSVTVTYTNLSTTGYTGVKLNEIIVAADAPSVTLTLPGLYFTGFSTSGVFPTALGTLASGTYATASFTDIISEYAYLSDQAYSYNVMQETQ